MGLKPDFISSRYSHSAALSANSQRNTGSDGPLLIDILPVNMPVDFLYLSEVIKMKLTEAIAREEGYYVNGGRANRNNNPGDINYGEFAKAHGATRVEIMHNGSKGRFAYFPTPALGFEAMRLLLIEHYKGMTVKQAIYKYAPPTDNNNTEAYIKNICEWVGCKPETIIDTLLEV